MATLAELERLPSAAAWAGPTASPTRSRAWPTRWASSATRTWSAVAEAVVTVQRDWGDRTNRRHARLKYTIAEHGIDWFRGEVERVAELTLPPIREVTVEIRSDDLLGWARAGRRPPGSPASEIQNGRIRDDVGGARLRAALRAIAADHGVGFRITPNQNLYLVDVPTAAPARSTSLLADHGVASGDRPPGDPAARRWPAPPCPPAAWPSPRRSGRSARVVDELQAEFDAAGVGDAVPTVRMTGCPNGCARPYVAGDRAGGRLGRPATSCGSAATARARG